MRAVTVSHDHCLPCIRVPRRPQRVPLNPAASAAAAPASAPPKAAKQYAANDPRRWWAMKERSSSSSGSSRSSSNSSAWPACGLPPAALDLAAALAPLAVMCGADAAPLSQAVRCLPPATRQAVLAHGCQVAQHMRSLGVPLPLLAATLRRCLPLFSKPPAAHAAQLMAELMEAGLNAAEALRCFERSPVVAGSTSLAPSLAALADLLSAGGSETGGSSNSNSNSELPSAAQLQLQPAAALLREQPGAASALLAVRPAELHRRAAYLSSSLGLSAAQLAAAVRRDASLLALPPETLEEQAAALAEELGMSGKQFAELAAACPAALANLAECIEELTHAASGLAGVSCSGWVFAGVGWAARNDAGVLLCGSV